MNRQEENMMETFREFYDQLGYSQAQLKWSSNPHNLLISGVSDFSALSKLKNVILSLRKDWGSQISEGIRLKEGNDYQKRLLLAQSQIEGLLKRKINFSVKDSNGGERVLDYTNLLNEKENQIIQLQKKIQNFEDKLRRAYSRQSELENHILKLSEQLKRNEQLIALKHNSAVAQVAISSIYRDALNRIKKNIQINRFKIGEAEKIILDGVSIPEVGNFDIKSQVFSDNTLNSRSRVYQQMPENLKYKTRLVQFFREFQRLSNQSQGISDFQVQRVIEGFLSNMTETKLYEKMQYSIERYKFTQNYKRLRQNFSIAAGIFGEFINQITRDNVNYRLPFQIDNIFSLLQKDNITAIQVQSGAVFINIDSDSSSKVVEVPVQDAKTKHLIHLLAHELKKLFLKYPKIQGQIDVRLAQFLKQQIIDVIEADQIQKLIQIVKFVPQIVKVENVYTHSTEKQRKVEFHLRVLIKALLQQLEKIRLKTGAVLQMDEGIIGMIKAEIMDAVNVDDILKTFRVTPKIVEVQKILEKIVQRIVEVPKVVTVQKIVQKIVQFQRIKQVERIVHVPIDKPLIVQTQIERLVPFESKIQTIVEVPTIVQKFIEVQKEVPKIVQIQVFRDKIVQVEVPVEVERIINHIQLQYQEVEVIQQKLVPVQKIIEKIIEVPIFVQKIIEKIVQIPKIIQVQKVIEKIVPVIQYRSAREVQNHIEIKYEIVEKIVEKIVPVIQIKERIKEVPQIIEVIKQVNNTTTVIKQVDVLRQKLVYVDRIKEVQRIQTKIVQVEKQVIKQVERYIQVPVIRQVAVIKQLIIEKPVISRIQSVHIKEVIVKEPLIVKEPVIVEIQKYINVYIEVPKTIKYIEEKIVEVPTIVDRIKEVPVIIQKIIEKMVQVPKVVQVQKIVEKVVVVPRVIEKVVEVPQFKEKIVQKEIIKEIIRQIQKIVHVPVIQQQIRQVEVIKNIYIQIQKPVEKIVERAVQVTKVEEKIITKQVLRQVPINLIHEIPKEIEVQKIVHQVIQSIKPVFIDKQIIVPHQIPVPVDRIIQKIVPRQQIIQRIIPVPQIIEKIVPVINEVIQIQQVERIIEKIVIEKSIEQVEKIVPYINQIIKEVPTMIEKLVYIETKVEQIVTAQQIIQKVIEKTITIPQIYQVEKIRQKLVEVPKLIEIDRIVPQIIRVNQYIQKIAEKVVEIPIIIEQMKEVIRQQQKIVALKTETTQILEVEKCVQKLVYAEKLKEVVRNVNYIEKVLQVIERIQQVPYAVTTTEEKFIEVPYILEKIVQKIVVMPQIVEVLRYVHEVCETESQGVCVDMEVGAHQAKYKELTKTIQIHLDNVLKQLRYLKSDQITRARIEAIQKFLEELRKFILFPRIVKVIEEKVVEKQVQVEKIIKMPVQDQRSIKMELSLSILVEKLIAQLKRVKKITNVNIELDQDIRLIFFAEINASTNLESEMQAKLKNYTNYIQRHFESLGNWTTDHQFMLNSFLQQRFLMAELIQNANLQIQQTKAISDQRMQGLKRYRSESSSFSGFLNKIGTIISENRPVNQVLSVIQQYAKYKKAPQSEPIYHLADLTIDNNRFESLIRQKDNQIVALKDSLYKVQHKPQNQASNPNDGIIKVLRGQIDSLRKQNSALQVKASQSGLVESYRQQISQFQSRNLKLQQQISRLKSQNYNQSNQIKLLLQNISFRRQPQQTFQQIDLGQSGERSRISQSSQGHSLTGSQAQGFTSGNTDNITHSVFVPQGSNFKSNVQNSGVISSKPSQNLYYDTGNFSGFKPEIRVGESRQQVSSSFQQASTSQFHSQSGNPTGQSIMRNFGVVEQSQGFRGQQPRNISSSNVSGRVQQAFNINPQTLSRYSNIEGQNRTSQAGQVIGEGFGRRSEVIEQSRQSENYRQFGLDSSKKAQNLYYSQHQSYIPSTQTQYLQQSQSQAQSSILNTPIQSMKYRSPSPTGVKMTESILKQQDSLSKLQAQSPQSFKKQETPKSNVRYYYGQGNK